MTAFDHTIEHLSARLSRGETTAHANIYAALDAAEKLNDTLNAFLQIDRAGATQRAEELDRTSAGASQAGGDASSG
ncbi:MAG: hypothetical protein LC754_10875 [Acidobacteria bacterium]|nr:hypothetical protein [Acidobacteriota bacterium]